MVTNRNSNRRYIPECLFTGNYMNKRISTHHSTNICSLRIDSHYRSLHHSVLHKMLRVTREEMCKECRKFSLESSMGTNTVIVICRIYTYMCWEFVLIIDRYMVASWLQMITHSHTLHIERGRECIFTLLEERHVVNGDFLCMPTHYKHPVCAQ